MGDLKEMVERYTIKYDRKIKSICAPLKECLGISAYSYFKVEQDGRFIDISSHAESAYFYYERDVYLKDPYVSHPTLLRSGSVLMPDSYNPIFMNDLFKSCQVRHLFLILQHDGDNVEGSLFAIMASDKTDSSIFSSHTNLLYKFIHYFKREAESLIKHMRGDNFNIKQIKNENFIEIDPFTPLSNKDPNVQRFLKLILPLSHREYQCLELFKKGKSAQMTGAMLGLSRRTVEFYFDNIKNKLGCRSKAELLEW